MKDLLLVGLGGFIGSILRYGIAIGSFKLFESKFYIGTLAVNLIGSFLIGILIAVYTRQHNHLNSFLIVGFCGGFTTFSTFSLDGMKLLRQSLFIEFFAYASISMIGGLLLCFIGYYFFGKG